MWTCPRPVVLSIEPAPTLRVADESRVRTDAGRGYGGEPGDRRRSTTASFRAQTVARTEPRTVSAINCERTPRARLRDAAPGRLPHDQWRAGEGPVLDTDLQKVCGGSAAELDDWVQAEVGVAPTRCGICQP